MVFLDHPISAAFIGVSATIVALQLGFAIHGAWRKRRPRPAPA